MKTTFLVCSILFAGILSAQVSFEIHNTTGANVTGTTQYLTGQAGNTISYPGYLVNRTALAKNVKMARIEITIIAGSDNAITFDQLNYPPFADTSLNVNIPAGDSVFFQGDYFPNGFNGSTVIQYCFFDPGNTWDEVCFTVDFFGNAMGVAEGSTALLQLDIYPSPAQNKITVGLPDGAKHISIRVMDYCGRTVISMNDVEGDRAEIDISGLSDGSYTVIVTGDLCGVGKFMILD
jgi:hypothetical protein